MNGRNRQEDDLVIGFKYSRPFVPRTTGNTDLSSIIVDRI